MQIDRDLVELCVARDSKAQKELYVILLPYLRAIARRYLRDPSYLKDVLQESFFKIFRSIDTVSYTHLTLPTICSV